MRLPALALGLARSPEGFPALMVTDTAFLRNANYHRAGDTYEKLDYGRMGKVVQAVHAVTQR